MSYVSNLQNSRKQKKNKFVDGIVKYSLLIIVLFVVFFILFSFALIIKDSILQVGEEGSPASWGEILFGNEFDMNATFAMGIIVFNTVWMAILVLLFATPMSVATALLITKVLKKSTRNVFIAIVSILAAIPSVVYGSFGKYFLLKFFATLGLSSNSTEAILLSIVFIVGMMVMPTITLMTITSIMLVDRKMEDSSEALGATRIQTSIYVTLRSAKTGIIVGMLFALGRCIGEATAISMLDGSVPYADGITLSPFNTSLFLSPVIMGALSGASQNDKQNFVYVVMSGLLLITVICLFVFAKFIEYKTDDNIKSKKYSEKTILTNNVIEKVNLNGQESLNKKEINIYKKYLKDITYKQEDIALSRANEISLIQSRSSLNQSNKHETYKNTKTTLFKALILSFSMIGVITLISIILFLLSGDLSLLLNWDYLTSRGRLVGNEDYYGLGMAMMGTIMNIIISLSIALPLGIAIATYTNNFMERDTKMAAFISFSFQIMTSIPAVIYGTLATIIFVQGGFIRTNYLSIVPIVMLALVILPTIIKQTQEGFKNIKVSQEEGSFALGASKTQTSFKIVISQSMPAILSAAILAISIVMADSAIMITIIGKPGTPASLDLWMQDGGRTLATQIYWLSAGGQSAEIDRAAAKDQIKAIGLILMLLIFWLTLTSQKIKNNKMRSALIMFVGITLYGFSFYLFGGSIILMILGLALGLIGAIYKERVK